jgi:hypothetical protein
VLDVKLAQRSPSIDDEERIEKELSGKAKKTASTKIQFPTVK